MVIEFKRQFRWRKLKLHYGYPDDFVLHQWQETTSIELLYVIYRVFFVTTLLVITYITLRQSLFENVPTLRRTIYISNWILFICLVSAFLGAILICCNFAFQYENNTQTYLENIPCLIKSYWLTTTIALDGSLITFIFFWILIYPLELHISLTSKMYHTLVPLFMLMDFWINSIPVRILHFYISFIFALVYILFTVVYEMAGGVNIEGRPYIYSVICWRKCAAHAILYCILALVFVVVVRFLLYGMHRFKNFLSKWIFDDEIRTIEAGRSYASADSSLSNLAYLK